MIEIMRLHCFVCTTASIVVSIEIVQIGHDASCVYTSSVCWRRIIVITIVTITIFQGWQYTSCVGDLNFLFLGFVVLLFGTSFGSVFVFRRAAFLEPLAELICASLLFLLAFTVRIIGAIPEPAC